MSKKRFEGIVVTDSADKTVRVEVSSIKIHPAYGKRLKRSKAFLAHDEENKHKVGDSVVIEETRPISKKKTWKVV